MQAVGRMQAWRQAAYLAQRWPACRGYCRYQLVKHSGGAGAADDVGAVSVELPRVEVAVTVEQMHVISACAEAPAERQPGRCGASS